MHARSQTVIIKLLQGAGTEAAPSAVPLLMLPLLQLKFPVQFSQLTAPLPEGAVGVSGLGRWTWTEVLPGLSTYFLVSARRRQPVARAPLSKPNQAQPTTIPLPPRRLFIRVPAARIQPLGRRTGTWIWLQWLLTSHLNLKPPAHQLPRLSFYHFFPL